jgi:hypothetical protein
LREPYEDLTPRQAAVRRYFTPTPPFPNIVGAALLAFIGLIVLIAGLAGGSAIGLVGLIALGIAAKKGIPRILNYQRLRALAEPKPSDEQMDRWRDEGIQPVTATGLRRLDLVASDQLNPQGALPPVVGLPQSSGVEYKLARGKDGKVRASHYDILVVYLTKWNLSTYQCVLEMETGNFVADETREFHYRDIVSVATSSDRLTMQLPLDHSKHLSEGDAKPALELTTRQFFRLRVASDEIALLVGIFNIGVYGDGSDVDHVLRQIRGRLREYTSAHEPAGGTFDDLHSARRRRATGTEGP